MIIFQIVINKIDYSLRKPPLEAANLVAEADLTALMEYELLFLHSSSARSWCDNNPHNVPPHTGDKKLKYLYQLQIFLALMLASEAEQSRYE